MAIHAYTQKPQRYFTGARSKFVDALPHNPTARLLEVGCGTGDTAAMALRDGKCGYASGIELCAEPARDAALKIHHVLVGDVEELNLPYELQEFDVLILSEVLEHLRDPWDVLRRLHAVLKSGAVVMAGSPNVAHHTVIRMLLKGQWDYEDVGVMDQTHLRWFTPATYAAMFEACGYEVVTVGPAQPLRFKARIFDACTRGRYRHLLHAQIQLEARRV